MVTEYNNYVNTTIDYLIRNINRFDNNGIELCENGDLYIEEMRKCKDIIYRFFYRENEGSKVEDIYEKVKDPKLRLVKINIPTYNIDEYIDKSRKYYEGLCEFIDDLKDEGINDEDKFIEKMKSYIERDRVFRTNLLYEVKKSYNNINLIDWTDNFSKLISLKEDISKFIKFAKNELDRVCSKSAKFDNVCYLYKNSTLIFIMNAILMIIESYRELVGVVYGTETIKSVNNTLDDNKFIVL